MSLTYRQLKEALSDLTEDQLDCDVTVVAVMSEDCFPASEFRIVSEEAVDDLDGALDIDHPVICALI